MGDAYSKMNAQNLSPFPQNPSHGLGRHPHSRQPLRQPDLQLGHRNPQGLVFSDAGQLYASEHGPATDDEVNLIQKGVNYGCPLIEGPCDSPMEEALCDSLDARDPLASWSPTQAPCGMDYFDHPSIPEWENSLLLTFLKKQHLRILHLDETGTEVTHEDSILYNEYGRLRTCLWRPTGECL